MGGSRTNSLSHLFNVMWLLFCMIPGPRQSILFPLQSVPCDISQGSTSNLAQAGLDHRAQTPLLPLRYRFLSWSFGQLYGSSHCLQDKWLFCRKTTSASGRQGTWRQALQLPATWGEIWRHSACFLGGPEDSQQWPQWPFSCLPACLSLLPLAPPSFSCLFLADSSQSAASSHRFSQRHHITRSALKY